MQDVECVEFLQWALPRLHRRWPGFRKVRRTACKRVSRRIQELKLSGTRTYREFLGRNPGEWSILDSLLPITISSFYRDKAVFDFLGQTVLGEIAANAAAREDTLRAWSIGCASGEEPYTLMLAWRLGAQASFPGLDLRILATDVDATVLDRARAACYSISSLGQLPATWREQAFTRDTDRYCLRAEFRTGIDFCLQDIRLALPPEMFHLILCRNLVFTYFDESTQRQILERLFTRLLSGGALIIGHREVLPPGTTGLAPWPGAERLGIYARG
ncbi:MAG: chemotaxis protein CheR [Gammaproteobacteria bacterium]|nr:chemotaxis protein CheR [Gammaproteobacteria bacterium]